MFSNRKILFLFLFFFVTTANAKLKIVTTTTDLAWAAKEIGGDLVEVKSLLNGTEDPHYLDAMPHFINYVSNADVFCMIGLGLEVGWAPKILTRSGNKKVQKGGVGYCDTGLTVKALDIPTERIDRSQGDVHPEGNPHYHLAPTYFIQGAQTILNTFINSDSKNAQIYLSNFEKFEKKLMSVKKEISNQFKNVSKKNIIEYHKEFTYFLKEYGFKNMGSIEEKPGIAPSAGQLARISLYSKKNNVALALAATTAPKSILKRYSEFSGTPFIQIPLSIIKDSSIKSYRDHQLQLAKALLKALPNE